MANANANLHKAKDAKNDEFYTQLTDVSKELMHYKQHFKDKIVFCNCDDPTWSAFWKYFHLNFAELGLKKLISTHYDKTEPTYKMEYTGGDDNDIEVGVKTPLEGNGDFRNQECLDLLDECDIVVTNPPFSLFREYVAVLMEHNKKFIILGNPNAVTYKEFFPLIKNNEVWVGAKPWSSEMYFGVPKEQEKYLVANKKEGSAYVIKDGQVLGRVATIWFTNLDIQKRHEKLILWKQYTPEEYPKYDNYDAINVDKVSEIPCDYYEAIGVPITFIDKFNPEQFEIIGADFDLASPIKLDNGKTGTGRFYVTRERERAFILSHRDTQDIIRNILINDIGIPEDQIEYRNGIMGVPITFLDKYNPEQFEILGLLQSSTDEQAGIPNLRYYNDFKEMRQDMSFTGSSGGKANGNPVIKEKPQKGNFLYNPITKEYVHSVYARIVICRKVGA